MMLTLSNLSRIFLLCFQLLFGLKINFCKSKLFSNGKGVDLLHQESNILKCSIENFPFTNLGVSVGLSPRKKLFWDPLINKVSDRLASWKCSSLNMEGKIVLIKSTLDSLPSYWFNLFAIPAGVCNNLEAVRRSFLWGKVKDQGSIARKLHLLNWSYVLREKSKGIKLNSDKA